MSPGANTNPLGGGRAVEEPELPYSRGGVALWAIGEQRGREGKPQLGERSRNLIITKNLH